MPLSSCVCTGRHIQVILQGFVVLCVVMARSHQERISSILFCVFSPFHDCLLPLLRDQHKGSGLKMSVCIGVNSPQETTSSRRLSVLTSAEISHLLHVREHFCLHPYTSPLWLVGCFLISCWFTRPFVSLYISPLFASYIHLPDACFILFWLSTFVLYISNPFQFPLLTFWWFVLQAQDSKSLCLALPKVSSKREAGKNDES